MSRSPLGAAKEKAARRVARFIGGVFICISLYVCFNVFDLKSHGIRASGKVIEKNIVVFSTEAGQGVKFRGNTWGFPRGATVTVVYLRENPQGSAMIERSPLEDVGYGWFALLYGCFLLYLFREKGAPAPDAGGFTAQEVERETPVLNDDGALDSFTREMVMKYSLKRPGSPHGNWQLLQKFPKEGGLPNGFVLIAKDPPPQLTRALVPFAEEYGDDYFEFERAGDVVSVYCYKAGKSTLKKLAAALNALEA